MPRRLTFWRGGISPFSAPISGERLEPDEAGLRARPGAQALAQTGGGIILFHDTQAQTAKMLPEFLRDLKRQGYRVVHVVAH